jgi:hypothetical protein
MREREGERVIKEECVRMRERERTRKSDTHSHTQKGSERHTHRKGERGRKRENTTSNLRLGFVLSCSRLAVERKERISI